MTSFFYMCISFKHYQNSVLHDSYAVEYWLKPATKDLIMYEMPMMQVDLAVARAHNVRKLCRNMALHTCLQVTS